MKIEDYVLISRQRQQVSSHYNQPYSHWLVKGEKKNILFYCWAQNSTYLGELP